MVFSILQIMQPSRLITVVPHYVLLIPSPVDAWTEWPDWF
jgi:hypothetical protein